MDLSLTGLLTRQTLHVDSGMWICSCIHSPGRPRCDALPSGQCRVSERERERRACHADIVTTRPAMRCGQSPTTSPPTLQNFTRPALTGAERPRGARLRRGAAAYGVAFPALQTPILAQKIARAPRAQPHLSRRAPRAAPPSGRAPRAASNLRANPISTGHQVLQRGCMGCMVYGAV